MVKFQEEMFKARRTLARHPATIKPRFIAAMSGLAHLSDRHIAEIPDESLRVDFIMFWLKLTPPTLGGESSIRDIASNMDADEVQMLVDDFLDLVSRVERTR